MTKKHKSGTIFTDREIKNFAPKEGQVKPYDEHEGTGKGFAITIFPSGKKSFVYLYHFGGRKRRMTLGKYPQTSLSAARQAHQKAVKAIESGIDPGLEKKRRKMQQRDAYTVKNLVEEYLEKHAIPNKRSWKEDKRMLYKDVIPAWGNIKAPDITRRDVICLLDNIKDRGSPIIANRTLACIRRMFNFAIKRAILEASPCVMIEAPAKENRRERHLSSEEIRTFWHGIDKAPMLDKTKLALKFLLVTAQRKSEVIEAEWKEFNLSTAVWTIPAEKAKNGIVHRVPLSPLALELLEKIKQASDGSRLLFPSKDNDKPIRGQSIDHALRRSMPIFKNMENFCPHDLRRSAASHMASLHIAGEILSRILNHAKRGVTEQHYIKHSYDDEKRNALNLWGSHIKNICCI